MRFYKIKKLIICQICIFVLLISMISIPVVAADTNCVTATTYTTVNQGDYAYCYVSIDSLETLAALDVAVHYDPTKVEVTQVYNQVNCSLYDSVINEDNLQFSYLFDGQGANVQTTLFYFAYRVLDNAKTGETYFDIVIGEAYDNGLNDVAVSGSRCSFLITESVTDQSCYIYGTGSVSTGVNQEFTVKYYFDTYQIASGTIVITYDDELFEVVAVMQEEFLSEKIVDVNTELSGEIYISFVGTEYSYNTDLISVTFRTIKNVRETSKITLVATELLDKELSTYLCSGYTTNVSILYGETLTGDSPEMWIDGTFSYENKQITLVISLEENAHLGAGDFVIAFDPKLVTYNSCTKEFAPTFFNIDDKNVDSGVLKFHIISLSDIVTEEKVLTVVFDVISPYCGETADFTLDGTGLTDSMTESILLNFIDDSVLLEYQVIFKDWDGTILSKKKYHYGDRVNVPDTPQREGDDMCTYTFKGWDKTVLNACAGDAVYTAVYDTYYLGFFVSGTITSFGASEDEVTVQLIQNGVEISSVVSKDGNYSLLVSEPGSYILLVSKVKHATRIYEIIVGKEDVIQDLKIHLKGDINGDGKINVSDVGKANAHAKKTKLLEGYEFTCADINADGKINISDVGKMNAHAKKTLLLW